MAGQSSNMTIQEVSKTIKGLEQNTQTMGNGSSSGSECNYQTGATNRQPAKRAK